MPQLVAIVLIGGVLWVAWRALRREMARVGDELDERDRVKSDQKVEHLERDADGVYRPKKGK